MIGTLLRAAGGAASFTLGSLWPMRWPAFPVAFFDFDMFNEPADALWAEAKERCAREARARQAEARELAAQTAIPTTVYPSEPAAAPAPDALLSLALDAMLAAHSGDLARAFTLAAQFQQQAGPAIADAVGRTLLDTRLLILLLLLARPAPKVTAAPRQKTAPRSAPSPQRPARGNQTSPPASWKTPRMRCAGTSLIVSHLLR